MNTCYTSCYLQVRQKILLFCLCLLEGEFSSHIEAKFARLEYVLQTNNLLSFHCVRKIIVDTNEFRFRKFQHCTPGSYKISTKAKYTLCGGSDSHLNIKSDPIHQAVDCLVHDSISRSDIDRCSHASTYMGIPYDHSTVMTDSCKALPPIGGPRPIDR